MVIRLLGSDVLIEAGMGGGGGMLVQSRGGGGGGDGGGGGPVFCP